MIIKINERIFEEDNSKVRIIDLFEKINKIIDEQKMQFNYLLIDGVEVKESFDLYIIDHIEEINQIEVICKSIQNLIEEILYEAYNYIQKSMPIISDLADKFYQKPGKKEWTSLGDLIEGLDWLIAIKEKIEKIGNLNEGLKNYEKWNEYALCIKKIEEIIPDFEEAIQNQDTVLVGDLLMYEIKESFNEAVNYLSFLIPSSGDVYVS